MSYSNTKAYYGLRTTATPTSPTTTGTPQVGIANTSVSLTDADVFYAVQALIVGSGSDLVVQITDGDKTGSTEWTAGSAQVESATVVAASGATSNGNLAVVVTSSGMTGSPLTVNVPLTTAAHTTAALIAQAIVDTLNANATVSARFTATRSTAAVLLTRKPTATYTVGIASVPVYLVGDASEFTIPTALGVTGATSTTGADAAAGVASAGCYVVGDGEDFEGNALSAIAVAKISAYLVKCESESLASIVISSSTSEFADYEIQPNSVFSTIFANGDGAEQVFTIEPTSTALVTIVVAGSTV
jgi:hypothetical protein